MEVQNVNLDATLDVALQRYRLEVSILKKGYVQETYRLEQIRRTDLAKKPVRDITSKDIASYRDMRLSEINARTRKTLSPATVRLEMSLMSNLFDIARIEWGLCEKNPVKDVRKPKSPPGRDRRLTPREERLILRYCHQHSNEQLYSIVVLALETAMRQGEILKLEWQHINLKNQIAHLPDTKNGTKRDIPLSLKARDMLIRLGVRSHGKVFGYTSNGLKSTWRFMLIKIGIQDLHFHDLRHEACSRLFELGTLDVMEIAAISGHKSLAMLKRYTHLRANKLVRKLEGNTHRGQQVVVSQLVPYPAHLSTSGNGVEIRLLDFDDVVGRGADMAEAVQSAQNALLRHLMIALRDRQRVPQPNQYLEPVEESKVIMLDPLSRTTDLLRKSA
ncbi:site-specific integrase [Pseudomonas sp. WS 5096]|uniref:Site-specific integrase n=1 Tax=Pseudomonas cremoris TaxID=2724178 RepID=A0ABR6TH95_9PSED|nr:site-specific integrase [Pseudomonas cremoris]